MMAAALRCPIDRPDSVDGGLLHAEKISVTHQEFKEVEWIGHLAAALERVATEARLSLSSPPPNNLGIRPQLTEAIAILREHPLD